MIFDNQSLDAAVTKVLGTLPSEHNVAIVGVVDSTGARAALAVRKSLSGDWTVTGEAFFGHEWVSNTTDYGVRVAMSGTL